MTEFLGRLRTPRLASAPSSPVVGEMYYNTASNKLFWWNGTTWVESGGGGGAGTPEVNVSAGGPSPRVGELLWVDTDEPTPLSGVTTVPIEAWHTVGTGSEPAFQNGWVNYDASRVAQFRKRPDGTVQLRGLIRTGASGSVAFTLPAGYRPVPNSVEVPIIAASSGTTGEILVASDGTVRPVSGSGNVTTYAFLDGVEFPTDQVTFPAAPAAVVIEAWHAVGGVGEPAFQSGYTAVGGFAPQFRKRPDGIVEMRGLVNGGPAGSNPIFTLPASYRPDQTLMVLADAQGASAGTVVPIDLRIETSGQVMPINSAPGAGWISLLARFATDQASFPAGPPGPAGPAGGGYMSTQVLDAGQMAYLAVACPATNSELGRNMQAGTDWRISYTPPVDCWWEFSYRIPQISKSVDGWAYAVFNVYVAGAAIPATPTTFGFAAGEMVTRSLTLAYGPSAGNFGASLDAKGVVPLTGGLTYTLRPVIEYTGLGWQIQIGGVHNPLASAKAWPR